MAQKKTADLLARAQGCMLGQLCGDALGAQVEFKNAREIHQSHPEGVRDMHPGGTFDLLAGQITDDSEMALCLASSLIELGTYDPEDVFKRYENWIQSGPFDLGGTIFKTLAGQPPTENSQANGAMMRISPLAIFGTNRELADVETWARADAKLTHPHPVCQQANVLYAVAICTAIRHGCNMNSLYQSIVTKAREIAVDPTLMNAIKRADDISWVINQVEIIGWVLVAFQNALHQLLHAESFEEALVETVGYDGDTDTNAAICGALLGAVRGIDEIPNRWINAVLSCRPDENQPYVRNPRPKWLWTVGALELTDQLLDCDQSAS